MRREPQIILAAAALLIIFVIAYVVASYWLADYQYGTLLKSGAKTKKQVERVLFLYTKRQIDIKESAWGDAYSIFPGEVCYQYRILAFNPIDIVFDTNGQVKEIFPSYE